MSDLQTLLAREPWAYGSRARVVELDRRPGAPLPGVLAELFPVLSSLLSQARTTDLLLDDQPFRLFTWTSAKTLGWLSPMPQEVSAGQVYTDHARLLAAFGGIVERYSEPPNTWLFNHTHSLTARQSEGAAHFIRDYAWAFEEEGAQIPIDTAEFYPISWEANGNSVICDRTTGSVLMFAPDHDNPNLIVLDGCPAYTLYQLEGATRFRDWVERVAAQWLAAVAQPGN